jgi:hypothetical protein
MDVETSGEGVSVSKGRQFTPEFGQEGGAALPGERSSVSAARAGVVAASGEPEVALALCLPVGDRDPVSFHALGSALARALLR